MQPKDSHNPADIRRAEARVNELERALEALYCQTGKAFLQQAEAAARQADSLTDTLITARQGLAALRADVRCPACQALNPRQNIHCGHCGSKLIVQKGNTP